MKKLTIHFMPYDEISNLGSGERIKKLLKLILNEKIILLQGRLEPEEEVRLIEDTMALIGHVKKFKGVELAVLNPKKTDSPFDQFKKEVARFLVGNRDAMTVIGPATIIKEIKRDPSKIELMLKKSK
ncbi:DUF2073 domain-containing protein [Nanoarchaeota archaeon]